MTGDSASDVAFRAALDELVGLEVWSVLNGFGSMCSIDAGPKRPRSRPIENAWLTTEQRSFEGEAQLGLWCAWFLDAPDPLTWETTDALLSRTGPLTQLIGRAVMTWEWEIGSPRLGLNFGPEIHLSVDCSIPCGLEDIFELEIARSTFELDNLGRISLSGRREP